MQNMMQSVFKKYKIDRGERENVSTLSKPLKPWVAEAAETTEEMDVIV